jgi:GNAT superfamily N-acetyltransferase
MLPYLLRMRVRLARADDVPWLCDALRAFAADYPAPISLYADDAHTAALVGSLISGQFVAIAESVTERVGLIAGLCEPHPFNPALLVATELWWWVRPDARGSSAGGRLFQAFESWAESQGAGAIAVTLEFTSPLADAALERRGYLPVERQFLRTMPAPVLAS